MLYANPLLRKARSLFLTLWTLRVGAEHTAVWAMRMAEDLRTSAQRAMKNEATFRAPRSLVILRTCFGFALCYTAACWLPLYEHSSNDPFGPPGTGRSH